MTANWLFFFIIILQTQARLRYCDNFYELSQKLANDVIPKVKVYSKCASPGIPINERDQDTYRSRSQIENAIVSWHKLFVSYFYYLWLMCDFHSSFPYFTSRLIDMKNTTLVVKIKQFLSLLKMSKLTWKKILATVHKNGQRRLMSSGQLWLT